MEECRNYESLKIKKKKQDVIERGRHAMAASCCSLKSCEDLASDLEEIKNECNDVFRPVWETEELTEKGNLPPGTLCDAYAVKQAQTMVKTRLYMGGFKKRRSKRRRTNKKKKTRRKTYRRYKH
jgi:hypothetical protein